MQAGALVRVIKVQIIHVAGDVEYEDVVTPTAKALGWATSTTRADAAALKSFKTEVQAIRRKAHSCACAAEPSECDYLRSHSPTERFARQISSRTLSASASCSRPALSTAASPTRKSSPRLQTPPRLSMHVPGDCKPSRVPVPTRTSPSPQYALFNKWAGPIADGFTLDGDGRFHFFFCSALGTGVNSHVAVACGR